MHYTNRPKYKDDIGLLNHELKHYEQWKKLNIIHILLYKYSDKYRYKCEIEAYKEQVKQYNYKTIDDAKWIVDALIGKYNLGVSEESKQNFADDIKYKKR